MMNNTGKLVGKTIFITGASRGIGEAIAIKCAKDGANIVIAAKTVKPHPKLPGTIYTAAEKINKAGGKALPCEVDIRDEIQVEKAVQEAIKQFGGIDIVVNNASAIDLSGTAALEMKKYDLMHNINTRGTFLVSKLCLPYLKKSQNAHILNMAPPLTIKASWFSSHTAYTIAKLGMSMCVLGMAEEFKKFNVSVNALWPRIDIQTAALDLLTNKQGAKFARKPEIMADAAYTIFLQNPKSPGTSGNFYIDEDILRNNGVVDFDQYCVDPAYKDQLLHDLFARNQ